MPALLEEERGGEPRLAFAAHIPWNLMLLVGVWRSSGRPGVSREIAYAVRLIIVGWVVALSLSL